ncbi:MAG: rRNA maturation RNase YbeY [Nevskiales bacterium]
MNIRRQTMAAGQPDDATLEQWLTMAFAHMQQPGEVAICIVDEAESAELNKRFRGKVGPTNVLSFPSVAEEDLPPELATELNAELGDLIICAAVVEREASEQDKALEAHWAHMLVHGYLHLLGFDHIDPAQAELMEAQEIEILQKMGYPDPYKS